MEQKFKLFMDEEEDKTFVSFSKAMGDLADIFKVKKNDKSPDERERAEMKKKKNFPQHQRDLSRFIYGVGNCPAESKNK